MILEKSLHWLQKIVIRVALWWIINEVLKSFDSKIFKFFACELEIFSMTFRHNFVFYKKKLLSFHKKSLEYFKKAIFLPNVHLEFHFENNPSKVFVNLICARASPHPLGRGKCIQRETNWIQYQLSANSQSSLGNI